MTINEIFKEQINTNAAAQHWTGKHIRQVRFDINNNRYPKIERMRLFLQKMGCTETQAVWQCNDVDNTHTIQQAFKLCVELLIELKDYNHYSYNDLFRYHNHATGEKTMRQVLIKSGWVETPAVWQAAKQLIDAD